MSPYCAGFYATSTARFGAAAGEVSCLVICIQAAVGALPWLAYRDRPRPCLPNEPTEPTRPHPVQTDAVIPNVPDTRP